MPTLPLTGIVDVNVNVSAIVPVRNEFNSACIICDNTTVISEESRIKEYGSLDEMITAGFEETDEEYIAAALYFAQQPQPQRVFVGVKGSAETLQEAITACRNANAEWYIAIPTAELVGEILNTTILTALSTYVESAIPSTILALTFIDEASYIDNLTALHAKEYSRTISMYDNANNGVTSIAGIIGYAMGNNTDTSKAFTLAYKSITGLTAITNFTSAELKAVLDLNGNLYINQATYYNLFRQGKMSNGVSFDEVMYLDMLAERIKLNIMIALTTLPKVPQTDEGINILENAISEACEVFVGKNFIAPGIWTGESVLSLASGDALSTGYLVQFAPLSTQPKVDREARIAPKCYVCIKTAGAVEHVVIAVNVNR